MPYCTPDPVPLLVCGLQNTSRRHEPHGWIERARDLGSDTLVVNHQRVLLPLVLQISGSCSISQRGSEVGGIPSGALPPCSLFGSFLIWEFSASSSAFSHFHLLLAALFPLLGFSGFPCLSILSSHPGLIKPWICQFQSMWSWEVT